MAWLWCAALAAPILAIPRKGPSGVGGGALPFGVSFGARFATAPQLSADTPSRASARGTSALSDHLDATFDLYFEPAAEMTVNSSETWLPLGGSPDAWASGPPESLVAEVDLCLQELERARAGRGLFCNASSEQVTSGATPARQAIRDSIRQRLTSLGPPPPDFDPQAALRDVLGAESALHLDRDLTVRPYDLDKIKFVKAGLRPRNLRELLPERHRHFVDQAWSEIVRTDAELPQDPTFIDPYTDPALRDPKALRELVKVLFDLGLVVFRSKRRGVIGVFCVAKKGGWLRLIFDCRQANQLHRRPPRTRLATAGAFTNIDLSEASLLSGLDVSDEERAVREPFEGSIAGIDLMDSYYQFEFTALASFYAFDCTFSAAELGLTSVYDDLDQTWHPIEPAERVWPCLGTLGMGAA